MNMLLLLVLNSDLAHSAASALLIYQVAILDSPLKNTNIVHQRIRLLSYRVSFLKGSQITEVLGDPHLVFTSKSLRNINYKQAIFEPSGCRHSPPRFSIRYTCGTEEIMTG